MQSFENSIPSGASYHFSVNFLMGFKTENEPSCRECPTETIPFSARKVRKTFVAYFHSIIETLEDKMRREQNSGKLKVIMLTLGQLWRSIIHTRRRSLSALHLSVIPPLEWQVEQDEFTLSTLLVFSSDPETNHH